MRIRLTTEAISKLVNNLDEQAPDVRIKSFIMIKSLALDLREALKLHEIDDSSIDGKIEGIIIYSRYAAGLDSNGKGPQKNAEWAAQMIVSLDAAYTPYEPLP